MTAPTHKAVAEALGVKPNTICRWLRQPAFRAAMEEVQRALYDTTFVRAQACGGFIVDQLIAIAEQSPRPGDRIRACEALQGIAERGCLRHSGLPPATPPMQPGDVKALLSSFIAQAAASDLPVTEKCRIIERLTSPLIQSIHGHELQVQMDKIEDVLKARDTGSQP